MFEQPVARRTTHLTDPEGPAVIGRTARSADGRTPPHSRGLVHCSLVKDQTRRPGRATGIVPYLRSAATRFSPSLAKFFVWWAAGRVGSAAARRAGPRRRPSRCRPPGRLAMTPVKGQYFSVFQEGARGDTRGNGSGCSNGSGRTFNAEPLSVPILLVAVRDGFDARRRRVPPVLGLLAATTVGRCRADPLRLCERSAELLQTTGDRPAPVPRRRPVLGWICGAGRSGGPRRGRGHRNERPGRRWAIVYHHQHPGNRR